jgi:hypothetical protein
MSARTLFLLAALIALLTLGRCAVHEFVDWDDRYLLADNPKFNPPTWGSVLGFILPRNADENLYIPASQLIWGLLAAIGRTDQPDARGSLLNPWIFHGANLVLHVACVGVVFAILRNFVADVPAWIGAIVFAIHPVQVEAIAWASGLRDLLSALFGFICLYELIRYRQTKGSVRWILATVAVALAMLSKPSAVALPLEAIVLDVLLLRTPVRRSLVCVAPWFAMAIPIILVTQHVQPIVWPINTPLATRPLIALDSISFYLAKLLLPIDLVFDYGRTPGVALAQVWRAIWFLPLLVAVGLMWKGSRVPGITAGALLALAGLMPVLGLIAFQAQTYSTVSDHYLYPSMLGVGLIVATAFEAAGRRWRRAAIIGAGAMIAAIGWQSFALAGVWSNGETLFSYALTVNPRSSNANAGLAFALAASGDVPRAIAHFQAAEKLNPHNGMAIMGLAQLLMREGDLDGAAEQYERLMRVYQMQANFDPKLGAAGEMVIAAHLVKHGDTAGAIAALRQAKRWDPSNQRISEMLARAGPSASTQPATGANAPN